MFPVRICIQLRSAAAAFEWHTAIPGLLWVPAWWLWSDPLQTSCCARPHAVVSIGKCQFDEVFIIKCPKKSKILYLVYTESTIVHHCSSSLWRLMNRRRGTFWIIDFSQSFPCFPWPREHPTGSAESPRHFAREVVQRAAPVWRAAAWRWRRATEFPGPWPTQRSPNGTTEAGWRWLERELGLACPEVLQSASCVAYNHV